MLCLFYSNFLDLRLSTRVGCVCARVQVCVCKCVLFVVCVSLYVGESYLHMYRSEVDIVLYCLIFVFRFGTCFSVYTS